MLKAIVPSYLFIRFAYLPFPDSKYVNVRFGEKSGHSVLQPDLTREGFANFWVIRQLDLGRIQSQGAFWSRYVLPGEIKRRKVFQVAAVYAVVASKSAEEIDAGRFSQLMPDSLAALKKHKSRR